MQSFQGAHIQTWHWRPHRNSDFQRWRNPYTPRQGWNALLAHIFPVFQLSKIPKSSIKMSISLNPIYVCGHWAYGYDFLTKPRKSTGMPSEWRIHLRDQVMESDLLCSLHLTEVLSTHLYQYQFSIPRCSQLPCGTNNKHPSRLRIVFRTYQKMLWSLPCIEHGTYCTE